MNPLLQDPRMKATEFGLSGLVVVTLMWSALFGDEAPTMPLDLRISCVVTAGVVTSAYTLARVLMKHPTLELEPDEDSSS